MSRLSIACVAVLLLNATTAFADTIVITADRALVWNRISGPSFVLTQVTRGARFDLIGRVGEWFEIVLPKGLTSERSGFIRTSQARIDTVGPMSQAAREVATAKAGKSVHMRPSFLNVDVSYRTGRGDLTRSISAFTQEYAEEGRIDANYGDGSGIQFDLLGSQAIWGHFGIGGGLSFHQRSLPTRVSASIPNPFFFNQPRTATLETKTPTGNELAAHIPILWMPRSSQRIKMIVFGGPSIFRITQQAVSAVTLDDPYPHDTVNITGVTTTTIVGTHVGFLAGGDVSYFFTKAMGVGGGVRYSAATVALGDKSEGTTWKAGGLQISTGLRFRF